MKETPKRPAFSALVVRPISNGYLIEIEAESEDISYSFKTFRQVLQFMRNVETMMQERED